jgi:hypothetical protein
VHIEQAVSRRLPTAAVRVLFQVRSCRICGGRSGTGAGSLRVRRFPLPVFIPAIAPYLTIIRGWYSRPNSGQRTKWTRLTPPQWLEALLSSASEAWLVKVKVLHYGVARCLKLILGCVCFCSFEKSVLFPSSGEQDSRDNMDNHLRAALWRGAAE